MRLPGIISILLTITLHALKDSSQYPDVNIASQQQKIGLGKFRPLVGARYFNNRIKKLQNHYDINYFFEPQWPRWMVLIGQLEATWREKSRKACKKRCGNSI